MVRGKNILKKQRKDCSAGPGTPSSRGGTTEDDAAVTTPTSLSNNVNDNNISGARADSDDARRVLQVSPVPSSPPFSPVTTRTVDLLQPGRSSIHSEQTLQSIRQRFIRIFLS